MGETIDAYDATATAFADRWFRLRLRTAMARFTAHLEAEARVLDVGCGPARDTAWLAEQGFTAIGVDLSQGMLREGQARGIKVPLIRADMAYVPFSTDSFQGLWVCASLLHIPKRQIEQVLQELARVVCPGGHVYVAVKRGEGEAWVRDEDGNRRFFAYYRPQEIQSLIEQAGLRILAAWQNADSAGRRNPWISVLAQAE
jgi:ubiquinone/menaquinone biosynthesis C-methylase UbiE